MKIPGYRNIISTDFPAQYKALLDQLGILINGAFNPLYTTLQNGLDFANNFDGTAINLPITVNSAGIPLNQTSFNLTSGQTTTSGILVLNATSNTTPATYPTGGIFVSFTQNGSSVNINNVTGLPANVQFTLSIICLA